MRRKLKRNLRTSSCSAQMSSCSAVLLFLRHRMLYQLSLREEKNSERRPWSGASFRLQQRGTTRPLRNQQEEYSWPFFPLPLAARVCVRVCTLLGPSRSEHRIGGRESRSTKNAVAKM